MLGGPPKEGWMGGWGVICKNAAPASLADYMSREEEGEAVQHATRGRHGKGGVWIDIMKGSIKNEWRRARGRSVWGPSIYDTCRNFA